MWNSFLKDWWKSMSPSLFNELKALPPIDPQPDLESSLSISLIIPARKSTEALETTVREAHQYLTQRFPGSFEIILVPNPAPGDGNDRSQMISEKLSQLYSEVQISPHRGPPGKGAA